MRYFHALSQTKDEQSHKNHPGNGNDSTRQISAHKGRDGNDLLVAWKNLHIESILVLRR